MEWPMFQRVERQAVRMHEMMERLDVDTMKFVRVRNGEAYAEARRRCLACGTCDKCLRWLDGESRQDRPPGFCPNLGAFEPFRKPSTREDD